MPPPSKIVIGRPLVTEPAEHVFAYGDSDDGPRLVALLAARLKWHVAPDSQAAKDVASCLDPRAPWRTRIGRLSSALHDALQIPGGPLFVLWDADALAFEQRESFDIERASLMRRDLFQVIRTSALEGGWILARTARARGRSLDDVDLRRELGAIDVGQGGVPEQAARFAAECQPLAAWLVKHDVLRARDLNTIRDTVADADGHLIDLVYQELPGPVRDAAKLMSTLRAPQPLNGHYGRIQFASDSDAVTPGSVPAAVRGELIACGILQPTIEGVGWRIPRLTRERLYRLAEVTLDAEVEQIHHAEAEAGTQTGIEIDDAVEAHYHAVCTGDADLAKRTAAYYGSELSDVARRLSLDAKAAPPGERKHLFRRAADLYLYVLQNFDDTDAYAWEYRGYNLALADGSASEVREAYAKANALRPGNPLYHGRLLGVRGQLGERIVEEALAGINKYALDDQEREPVAYFAKAVLDGLRRGGERPQERAIVSKCRDVLQALAPNLLPDA